MVGDVQPEYVLKQLDEGAMSPVYLFYGASDFMLEKVLNKIREIFIPESLKDFNVEIFNGGESDPAIINDAARSLPFMSSNRLVIIRRTEEFRANELEQFIPYLDDPVDSTCLIFIAAKTDFKRKFYKKIKEAGKSVNFKKLNSIQVISWINRMAKELGLDIESQACVYLHQVVGNSLRELYAELEKLYLRHGETRVGIRQVKELVIHSRNFTIFELMDEVSFKHRKESLSILNRVLEIEDREGILRILGMLNRQVRLLCQSKTALSQGDRVTDLPKKLGIPPFTVQKLAKQSRGWTGGELEKALQLLHQADALYKSGSSGRMVLENIVISFCS